MRGRGSARWCSFVVGSVTMVAVVAALTACSSDTPKDPTPGLASRGTVLTTAKPTRQDLANTVSLDGKVTLNPVFGLVAPVTGEVRYFDVAVPKTTPTKPTRVATVWAAGKPNYVEVPAGAVLAGRLAEERATVTAGTPIVSAKRVGYGIVADIDVAQAYAITDSTATVRGQIKNGPGPFDCSVLGTIAALPEGSLPAPQPTSSQPAGEGVSASMAPGPPGSRGDNAGSGSEPTGMRLVCVVSGDVKLINGASATLQVVTAKASNVLVLPVEAVAGSQGKGKVTVVAGDGSRQDRDVALGLTDGKVVEIKSGLTGDETVAIPGPNLPEAQGNGGEGGSGVPMGAK